MRYSLGYDEWKVVANANVHVHKSSCRDVEEVILSPRIV